jgi:crossover junction endodeoxyribonuclease RusA
MKNELEIDLPWPPSVNAVWKSGRGRVFTPKKVKDYHIYVRALMRGKYQIKGRIDAFISVYPPDKRIRDIDNLLKIPLDSLQKAGVYKNDNQIDQITITRKEIIKGGFIRINLKERE